jgi:hypothetical protein
MFNPMPKSGPKPKKSPKPLRRTKIKVKRKPTGEKAVFESISSSREWICFVTGTKMKFLTATSFCHVLSKADNKYPKFIHYEPNIVLVQDWIHFAWDHTPRSSLVAPMWKKMFKKESELKKEYKEMYGTL